MVPEADLMTGILEEVVHQEPDLLGYLQRSVARVFILRHHLQKRLLLSGNRRDLASEPPNAWKGVFYVIPPPHTHWRINWLYLLLCST